MSAPTPSRPRRITRRSRLLALVALIPFLASCSDGATTPAGEESDGLRAQLLAAKGGGSGHSLEVSPTEGELWVDPAPPEEPRQLALDVTVMNKAMCVLPDRTARFTSSDESVATVDRDGVITSAGVGEAVITATRDQEERTVDVVVDDGVRTPSGLMGIIIGRSGSLLIGGDAVVGDEGPSPFEFDVTGPITITMDGVTIVSGVAHVFDGATEVWDSIDDFEAQFGFDLSPGVEHTITFDYGGATFYRPLSFSVQWSIDDGSAVWRDGVRTF